MATIKSLEINKVNSVKIEIKIKKIFFYGELNIISVIISFFSLLLLLFLKIN